MKELARVVHSLVTGGEVTFSPNLSRLERAALADLESLLRLSPRALSNLLAQSTSPPDWWVSPSISCDSIRS